MALVSLIVAARLRKRAATLPFTDAHHFGAGRVVLSTTAVPIVVAVAAHLPVGPIVLGGEQSAVAPYREMARYDIAMSGSLTEHQAARMDLAASLTALALAASALGAAPLVAARVLFGL